MRVLAVVLVFTGWTGVAAAPEAELWERWARFDDRSTARIDHSDWDAFLKRNVAVHADGHVDGHVDGINRVNYAGLSAADRALLKSYLERLTRVTISTHNRPEQFAYWVNLYNALTVQVILDHYPVQSILDIDISPGIFSAGPWGAKLVQVEGEELSLDDIEHRILRPIWQDPRIHYVVNCASIGCPNLSRTAFTTANTEAQLKRSAKEYINHPRGVAVTDGNVVASRIYEWYGSDFGKDEADIIAHFRRYAEAPLQAALVGKTDIDEYEYNWDLNGQPIP